MNVERLERIKQLILEEPRRFNMATFFDSSPMGQYVRAQNPLCGKVACIAGHAVLEFGNEEQIEDLNRRRNWLTEDHAMKILDLPNTFLFYAQGWKGKIGDKMREHYFDEGELEFKAELAALAIDDYIASGGWVDKTEKAYHVTFTYSMTNGRDYIIEADIRPDAWGGDCLIKYLIYTEHSHLVEGMWEQEIRSTFGDDIEEKAIEEAARLNGLEPKDIDPNWVDPPVHFDPPIPL